MIKLALVLLTAPLGYALLTGYLVSKIKPTPLTFLPARIATDVPLEALAA